MKPETIEHIKNAINRNKETIEKVNTLFYEKDLRDWFKNNYNLLGIESLILIRRISADRPDFKVLVNGEEIDLDLVFYSSKVIDCFVNHKQELNLVLCCEINHFKETTMPIILIPLKHENRRAIRLRERKDKRKSLKNTNISFSKNLKEWIEELSTHKGLSSRFALRHLLKELEELREFKRKYNFDDSSQETQSPQAILIDGGALTPVLSGDKTPEDTLSLTNSGMGLSSDVIAEKMKDDGYQVITVSDGETKEYEVERENLVLESAREREVLCICGHPRKSHWNGMTPGLKAGECGVDGCSCKEYIEIKDECEVEMMNNGGENE